MIENTSDNTFEKHLQSKPYQMIKVVKINFRFLHMFVKQGQKIEYNLAPQTKLWEIKKMIDEKTKKNLIFFLRESFIPSLDSKIGDVAFCYGRLEGNEHYEITLTASENPHEYG